MSRRYQNYQDRMLAQARNQGYTDLSKTANDVAVAKRLVLKCPFCGKQYPKKDLPFLGVHILDQHPEEVKILEAIGFDYNG